MHWIVARSTHLGHRIQGRLPSRLRRVQARHGARVRLGERRRRSKRQRRHLRPGASSRSQLGRRLGGRRVRRHVFRRPPPVNAAELLGAAAVAKRHTREEVMAAARGRRNALHGAQQVPGQRHGRLHKARPSQAPRRSRSALRPPTNAGIAVMYMKARRLPFPRLFRERPTCSRDKNGVSALFVSPIDRVVRAHSRRTTCTLDSQRERGRGARKRGIQYTCTVW